MNYSTIGNWGECEASVCIIEFEPVWNAAVKYRTHPSFTQLLQRFIISHFQYYGSFIVQTQKTSSNWS